MRISERVHKAPSPASMIGRLTVKQGVFLLLGALIAVIIGGVVFSRLRSDDRLGSPSADEESVPVEQFVPSFNSPKVYEDNSEYDREQKRIEENTKYPISHCVDEARPCDVKPEDLNVVVHVPEGLSLRESFQSPMDTGLLRVLRFFKGDSPQDNSFMYATSADFSLDIGEGRAPFAADALDLTKPIGDVLGAFLWPNIREARIVDIDGRKGLVFDWMGDEYGCNRLFEVLFIVPNPNHAYSNFIFSKTLDMTLCDKPDFEFTDVDRLAAEHRSEVQKWLKEIDQLFDFK